MVHSASRNTDNDTYTGIPTYKILMWISIASSIMLFAGLTSGYIVRQADSNWFVFELPQIFYVSTVLIVLSSISMFYAQASVKKDNMSGLRSGLIITLGLGLAFCFTQFLGWSKLVDMGVYFTGNPSGSFLYVMTGLHLAHLVGGIIYMMVVTTRSIQGRYNSDSYLSVSLCSIFWHFLDGIWVYLFVFLLLMR